MTEELPQGWTRTPLGAVLAPVRKVDPASLGRDEFKYIDIGSIGSAAYHIGPLKPMPVADAPQRARQLVREGDTVFSTVRPYLRKIAAIDASLDGEIASTGFCVLRATEALEPRYLFYLAQWDDFVDQVVAKQRGVSYPAVRDEDFRGLEIPVPPLPEQRRIVAALDEQLSRLEMAAETMSVTRRKLAAWESSYLLASTVDHPAADDWTRCTIGSLAKVSTGATPARGRSDYYEGGTIPWVTSTLLNAPYVDKTQTFITEKALRETSVKKFPAGTLLLAMYGEGKTRGRCSELRIEATTNQACAAIQLHERHEELRPWVKLVLEATYDRNRRRASGGVQPNLNLGMVREIEVPVPPERELKRILAEADRQRTLAQALAVQLDAAVRKASSLRRSLLAAAFGGRLVPQDPDDQPAAIVLDLERERKRVRSAPTRTRSIPAGVQEELSL